MKLAAVGSNCIDYYNNLDGGKAFPGGGPVNMAVYTVRLGGEAAYIGPVGNDSYGELMIDAMKKKSVDTSHLRVEEGKTAVSQVELVDGERILGDYEEGVLETYVLSDEDMDFIQNFDVVICDVWGKVEGQFKELKERGITTAFDCATYLESNASEQAIPYTDFLFYSTDENDSLQLREQMKKIHEKGPKYVICMMGTAGSMCYDGKDFHRFGIIPCEEVVDSMGAGDSYIAGFLKGMIEGKTIEEAMKLGAANATETLKYFGAW
jgi:fructoselysine 6-kinase